MSTKSNGLSHEEIAIACRNIGINLECGGCASAFYTGHNTEHDSNCTRPEARTLIEWVNKTLGCCIQDLSVTDLHPGTSERDDNQEKGLDNWLQLTEHGGNGFHIECFGCGVETRWFETAEEAILAWNRRVPLTTSLPEV